MKTEPQKTLEQKFDQCVKCTICTVYCPVIPMNFNFPGPREMGPGGEFLREKDEDAYEAALKLCMNCKRCDVACPSGIHIGDLIQRARIYSSHRPPGLRSLALGRTDNMGRLASRMAPLVNAMTKSIVFKLAMEKLVNIDRRRTYPTYALGTFEGWYHKEKAHQERFAHHVTYFHGSYVNFNYPQLGQDLIKILNAVGYGVHLLEEEHSCGMTLMMNNQMRKAVSNGRKNLRAIRKAVLEERHSVIATSSTVAYTLRDEYPYLFGLDNADVRGQIETATRFIYRLVDEGKVKLAFKRDYLMHVGYHTPCHMERLGWGMYSIALLRLIPGVDLVVLPSECCGMAGTYGYKRENYETSQRIGEKLFSDIREANVHTVATDCETCKWQIEMSIHAKVMHPISILAAALDVEATRQLNGVTV